MSSFGRSKPDSGTDQVCEAHLGRWSPMIALERARQLLLLGLAKTRYARLEDEAR